MVPLEWRGWSTLWFLHGDGKCLIQILIMANSKVGFINRKEMQLYYHITYGIYQLGKMLGLKKFDPFTLSNYHGIIMSIHVININDLNMLKRSMERGFDYLHSIQGFKIKFMRSKLFVFIAMYLLYCPKTYCQESTQDEIHYFQEFLDKFHPTDTHRVLVLHVVKCSKNSDCDFIFALAPLFDKDLLPYINAQYMFELNTNLV